MSPLADFKCVPCRGSDPPLAEAEVQALLPQVPAWNLIEKDGIPRLEQVFMFENFSQALAFANQVGALAEAEGHHPALLTEWGRVTVSWWTHKIKGLHQNDFIMAARTDALYSSRRSTDG
jgi:4a-hydroxytetrahydrobiopterin dehydratase